MNKVVWESDPDLNGSDNVARITKVDGNFYLEVSNDQRKSFFSRLKMAWRVLTRKPSIFTFIILSDKDDWVRRIDCGKEDS